MSLTLSDQQLRDLLDETKDRPVRSFKLDMLSLTQLQKLAGYMSGLKIKQAEMKAMGKDQLIVEIKKRFPNIEARIKEGEFDSVGVSKDKTLENLNVAALRKLVTKYNKDIVIPKYKTLSKDALIAEIRKRFPRLEFRPEVRQPLREDEEPVVIDRVQRRINVILENYAKIFGQGEIRNLRRKGNEEILEDYGDTNLDTYNPDTNMIRTPQQMEPGAFDEGFDKIGTTGPYLHETEIRDPIISPRGFVEGDKEKLKKFVDAGNKSVVPPNRLRYEVFDQDEDLAEYKSIPVEQYRLWEYRGDPRGPMMIGGRVIKRDRDDFDRATSLVGRMQRTDQTIKDEPYTEALIDEFFEVFGGNIYTIVPTGYIMNFKSKTDGLRRGYELHGLILAGGPFKGGSKRDAEINKDTSVPIGRFFTTTSKNIHKFYFNMTVKEAIDILLKRPIGKVVSVRERLKAGDATDIDLPRDLDPEEEKRFRPETPEDFFEDSNVKFEPSPDLIGDLENPAQKELYDITLLRENIPTYTKNVNDCKEIIEEIMLRIDKEYSQNPPLAKPIPGDFGGYNPRVEYFDETHKILDEEMRKNPVNYKVLAERTPDPKMRELLLAAFASKPDREIYMLPPSDIDGEVNLPVRELAGNEEEYEYSIALLAVEEDIPRNYAEFENELTGAEINMLWACGYDLHEYEGTHIYDSGPMLNNYGNYENHIGPTSLAGKNIAFGRMYIDYDNLDVKSFTLTTDDPRKGFAWEEFQSIDDIPEKPYLLDMYGDQYFKGRMIYDEDPSVRRGDVGIEFGGDSLDTDDEEWFEVAQKERQKKKKVIYT